MVNHQMFLAVLKGNNNDLTASATKPCIIIRVIEMLYGRERSACAIGLVMDEMWMTT